TKSATHPLHPGTVDRIGAIALLLLDLLTHRVADPQRRGGPIGQLHLAAPPDFRTPSAASSWNSRWNGADGARSPGASSSWRSAHRSPSANSTTAPHDNSPRGQRTSGRATAPARRAGTGGSLFSTAVRTLANPRPGPPERRPWRGARTAGWRRRDQAVDPQAQDVGGEGFHDKERPTHSMRGVGERVDVCARTLDLA